ncbi:protein TOPLESS [Tanacetum coccineum]
MSSSNPPSNFSRKPRISVRQVWRKTTHAPQSSTPSQNPSPPSPPRNNLQHSPSSFLNEEQMENRLQHISPLLETNLQHSTNSYSQIPSSPHSPLSPLIHSATLDKVNFHSGFFHCASVGTNVGDIGLWEVGSRDKLVLKYSTVWDIGACSRPFQWEAKSILEIHKDSATMVINDSVISDGDVNGGFANDDVKDKKHRQAITAAGSQGQVHE